MTASSYTLIFKEFNLEANVESNMYEIDLTFVKLNLFHEHFYLTPAYFTFSICAKFS